MAMEAARSLLEVEGCGLLHSSEFGKAKDELPEHTIVGAACPTLAGGRVRWRWRRGRVPGHERSILLALSSRGRGVAPIRQKDHGGAVHVGREVPLCAHAPLPQRPRSRAYAMRHSPGVIIEHRRALEHTHMSDRAVETQGWPRSAAGAAA